MFNERLGTNSSGAGHGGLGAVGIEYGVSLTIAQRKEEARCHRKGYMRIETIPGVEALWGMTQGDPNICVAVLDGRVELNHECFQGSRLSQLDSENSGHNGHLVADRQETSLILLWRLRVRGQPYRVAT